MALAKRLGEVAWAQPATKGEGPSPRSGHSITVTKGDSAIIFGGCGITAAGSPAVFNETWLLSTAEPMRWELADVMGDVPSPRWRHTATLLPDRSSILVFGGLAKGRRFNDTYVFSSDKKEWNIKECAGTPPHPRSHHTASLVEFEKQEAGFDAADDEANTPRAHTAEIDADSVCKVIVVGGYGGPGTCRDFFMDVHILELDSWSWTKVSYMKGEVPKPRSDHCVCVSDAKLILSGGRGWSEGKTHTGFFDDVHVLDARNMEWPGP